MPTLDALIAPDFQSTAAAVSGFHYSAVRPERLQQRAYSLMTLAIDTSGSIAPLADTLRQTLNHLVRSAQQQPIAEHVLLRALGFDHTRREWHGFQPLREVSPYGPLHTDGGTALYDATFDALNATVRYAKVLIDQGFSVNALLFVLTDGEDNQSRLCPQDIAQLVTQSRQRETPSRLRTALIGLNTRRGSLHRQLQTFQRRAQLDDYLAVPDASPSRLAALGQLVGHQLQQFAHDVTRSASAAR